MIDRYVVGALAALTILILLMAGFGVVRGALLMVLLVFLLMFLMSLAIGLYLLGVALRDRYDERRRMRR